MGLLTSLHISAVLIYMILVGVLAIDSFLNAVHDIYGTFEISKQVPIKSFLQALTIILYLVSGTLILSIILNRTPFYFLSGLGALTAVLMLVFKDAILGFVAGIQLIANRMVTEGDWIEMPRYGADGDVLEVTLTTVKVQNWDKTITTVPTYALISESFKNWSGMQQSGGRRIKRALHIDMNSIRFCNEERIKRFSKIQYISEYVETKRTELAEYNRTANVDNSSLANGRRMTNIGMFRAYIEAYLKNHPMVSQEMTFIIRQLAPGEHGLPIEIYVFCKDTRWAHYEATQADIFDHTLAVLPEFDLACFSKPVRQRLPKFSPPQFPPKATELGVHSYLSEPRRGQIKVPKGCVATFKNQQESDWLGRPGSVSCNHLEQLVDGLNLSPNIRTAHPLIPEFLRSCSAVRLPPLMSRATFFPAS